MMGLITISGLHGLPPYLYFYNHVQLHPELFPQIFQTLHPLLVLPVVALGAGRLLCMAVEASTRERGGVMQQGRYPGEGGVM